MLSSFNFSPKVKPQLEAVLRLPPDSLTKEIKLTQVSLSKSSTLTSFIALVDLLAPADRR